MLCQEVLENSALDARGKLADLLNFGVNLGDPLLCIDGFLQVYEISKPKFMKSRYLQI
jgi:hypothetical protein